MSLLVIKLPPRQRLSHRAGSGGVDKAAALKLPSEWPYVFSADGRQAGPLAQAALVLLPRADEVVLLLPDTDVSWHQVRVPAAPATRLRAALAGVMEEALLDDDEAIHLALAPGSTPGQLAWVAVTHGPRLAAALAALEAGDRVVHRVLPSSQPTSALGATAEPGTGDPSAVGPVRGHFSLPPASLSTLRVAVDDPLDAGTPASAGLADDVSGDGMQLSLARADGAWCLPLPAHRERDAAAAPGLAQSLIQATRAAQASAGEFTVTEQWTTTPAAALAAEQLLGRTVPLQTDAEHTLECAQRGINLRQFGLARRSQGLRALGDLGRRLRSTEWRWLRAGALAFLALQLLGLNAYAWQQQQALQSQRSAMAGLLRQTHPAVRTVLDAPAQMAGETERLRAAAGEPGAADLEVLLAAAAAAWPAGKEPVTALQFETGRLSLTASGWRADEVQAFTQRLAAAGWLLTSTEGRLVLTRAARLAANAGSTP